MTIWNVPSAFPTHRQVHTVGSGWVQIAGEVNTQNGTVSFVPFFFAKRALSHSIEAHKA